MKKLLVFSLGLGLAFTSCETDTVSEEIPAQENLRSGEKSLPNSSFKIHEPDWLEGPGAEIHEPDWMEGPVANIHQPDWIAALAWFECGENYTGHPNLSINKNNPSSYSSPEDGIVSLKNLNIGGDLYFCGLLATENTVNIHRAGEFNLAGEMMIGSIEEPADLVINSGAHLNFAGTIIVTGNLIINPGATVEIYGEGEEEVIFVGGTTEISEDANVVDHREHTHEH
ncbi:hypothetical protein [Christiangramia sp.]|uniref:hypothetical protein n=1 Tax=Christiangramia sp. TaxID=1931228 RepID=UPI0026231D3F|nr:hypothetical protein [Christiangramia sp.]